MKKSVLTVLLAIMLLMSACGNEVPEEAQATPTAEIIAQAQTETEAAPPEESPVPDVEDDDLAKLMAAIEGLAEEIQAGLDNAMTQREMTEKAGELYEHWDAALNHFWSELKKLMPEDEFSKLLEEQLAWIADKESAMEQAGKTFEGGTAYSMAIYLKGAEITETRVYELYELLRQYNSK